MRNAIRNVINTTKPHVVRREFILHIKDFNADRGRVPCDNIPILTLTDENVEEVRQANEFLANIGLPVIFMKKYQLSLRELEFLYIFIEKGLNAKYNGQNALFEIIRKEKPEHLRTHQDNTKSFPITETYHNLMSAGILIKQNKETQYSPIILNPEIINEKNIQSLKASIQNFLYSKEPFSLPPLLKTMTERINENLKTYQEKIDEKKIKSD